ncbi:TIGR03618 family F420-dependent PPOX class oxidoreductase [Georgenia deserti]|uniref:TIGR03618 family F420-dependent PPOX class oxidoreductase n=1 Tax=Georgenia deserti TaxID=2093781 RepID=A0ABW4KYC7_9MICO
MLDPTVRAVLDGTPIAHLATVLPDGGPHAVPVWIGTHGEHVVFFTGPGAQKRQNLRRDPRVALSLTGEDPYQPVVLRGRVVEWRDGEPGWSLIDELSVKYTDRPYPREDELIAALVEPEYQKVGL